ncbi:hypothetical protein PB2503_04137 [Parvularcula bermudensis HTCC2503]|uniref:Uncharacterized protein n=1 Tax=Parvularcula bermudensis (strain ATCC BAA-594 / HTCC2503 / KCTC 12087) TaxID=314260 RepID=E0TEL9_PARBH|nr:hypothetical protein [Parvularcula bermudensis]ADM08902.1 hypothetical protein PB2503_04137 [Parvularcula bermudensis HTCC2503]
MALDLTDRSALKALVKNSRQTYGKEKAVSVPQKIDNHVASALASLAEADVSVEESELKDKLSGAFEQGAGGRYVSSARVMKEIRAWTTPLKPVPAPPAEEEAGEASEE